MSRTIFQVTALVVFAASLCGCPLLNPLLQAPESAFEASPTSGQAPLTVLFIDASEPGTVNISEWQWDFGDGTTSTARNPSHIYDNPGLYTVSLTVTSSVGTHTALKRDYIQVVQPPVADFEATPALGGAPLTVNFSDTSAPGSSPIIDWQWNFGDRKPTSAEQNPVHVYDRPGLYTVSLTVTTAAGSDTVQKPQFINVAGNPVAAFEPDVTSGTGPLTVTFTDASNAGTAAITGWTWDFGDGGMSMDQNPTHTFETPGVYTVSLTVESEVGEDMVVRENLITVEEGPTAAFMGDPVMGPAPLSVAFTDASSAGSEAITNWLWNFGDGGLLSTRQNATRVYNVPGVYTVSLRVTSPVGNDTLEEAGYITVLPGVSFTANQTNGMGALTVQFIDQSATGDFEVSAWAWDFGDGGMSTEPNPEHAYAEPGVYDVSLAITTDLGDSMATEAAYITVLPATDFSAAPASGPPPLEVTFTDETAAGNFEVSAWAWDFGAGATSMEESPVHTYETPGIYSVSLETTTNAGLTARTKAGLIRVDPLVGIGANTTSGQGSLTVNFTDMTDAGNLNLLSWFWDFGDGMTSTAQNPTHTYQQIGTYTVSLRVSTALGDTTATEADFINVGPIVDFSSDVQGGTGALTVTFTDLTEAGTLEIEKWAWDFGDGMVSDEQNPSHDYIPGQYSVTLTVTTSQGETATTKEDLIVVAPLVAIDRVQPAGPAPFEASLLDITMPGMFEITGWDWNFGDGGSSTERNPVHVFVEPGTYTVTLTITTDGGSFSVTEENFITAQRGPTAMFSQTVLPGVNPDNPVTVSFLNMSLPGDAPILNQTWDFGASAIFTEEDTEAENPTITYPGPAFASVPQDVSLTVRTFIGADTLLKENLFGAKSSRHRLGPDMLWETEFQALAINAHGDVWAGGLRERAKGGPDLVLARLSPAGGQRWGLALETDEPLRLAGLAAGPDGTLFVVGTLFRAGGAAVYLACFDAHGELSWERTLQGAVPMHGAGIGLGPDGGYVALGHIEHAKGVGSLVVIGGDAAGHGIHVSESDYRLALGPVPVAALGGGAVLLGAADGTMLRADIAGDRVSVAPWIDGALPLAGATVGAIAWDEASETVDWTVMDDAGMWVISGQDPATEVLPIGVGTPHGLAPVDNSGAGTLVRLERDLETQSWVVRRSAYTR